MKISFLKTNLLYINICIIIIFIQIDLNIKNNYSVFYA